MLLLADSEFAVIFEFVENFEFWANFEVPGPFSSFVIFASSECLFELKSVDNLRASVILLANFVIIGIKLASHFNTEL